MAETIRTSFQIKDQIRKLGWCKINKEPYGSIVLELPFSGLLISLLCPIGSHIEGHMRPVIDSPGKQTRPISFLQTYNHRIKDSNMPKSSMNMKPKLKQSINSGAS